MADEAKPRGYLAKYGGRLLDAGYQIIPIKRGSKAPAFDGWQKARADKKTWRKWVEGPYARSGVGILTRLTPAADLDIRDEAVARHMQDFVETNYGFAPVRVGQAPKRLLLFRTDTPFRKVQSPVYEDEWGDAHKVEILGDGQQFVAYAVHPDTGRPFEWVSDNPIKVKAADLPEMNEDFAREIVAEFNRVAAEQGWGRKKSSALARTGSLTGGVIAKDDVFAADASRVEDLTEEELHAKLLLVPGAEDYDTWFQIGMALYHQYDGEQRGLDLWHEWSATASNYAPDEVESKWATFDIDGKGRAPVTARLIIKLAREAQQEIATETFREITTELREAVTLDGLRKVCEKIKHIEFDVLARAQIVGIVQKRFKDIAGSALLISTAREMVRYENPDPKELPKWLEGWVYVGNGDNFYSITRRLALSTTAFNAIHGRNMLTKRDVLEGKSVPETSPSMFALNNKQIPVVQNMMYLPGEDDIFWFNGTPFVNTYDTRGIPETPKRMSAEERAAVELVESHFSLLFEVDRDREILLDALAYVVQNPGKRLNWAILLQGTEGDGKTFVGALMAAAIGASNVRTLTAQALEEKYSPWAEGSQVVFVEEIKLHGHNRFDVLNKIKPNITNVMVSVRRMNTDLYEAVNTATYILTTNFRDALPINDNDSRYFILFSRFQTAEAIAEFEAEDPTYYARLYRTLEHAGALRRWLLGRKIGPNFNPQKRAPMSEAKKEMVMYSKSEEAEALDEILAESARADMSKHLLNATDLADEMMDKCGSAPYGKAMNKLLLDAGFTRLGKVRVGDKLALYWSQKPRLFTGPDGGVDPLKLKRWLADDL